MTEHVGRLMEEESEEEKKNEEESVCNSCVKSCTSGRGRRRNNGSLDPL